MVGAVKLTVLGSNGASPAPGNPASGYLVEALGATLWMDAGPGTFMEMAKLVEPSELDAVVLSHTHVDHCADLLGLFAYLAYAGVRAASIPVFAPAGTKDHFAAFARADDGHVFHDVLDFKEVRPGDRASVGGFELQFGHAIHPVPALVTRIEAGSAVLAYSGDTGPGGDLITLATGASLLLCEASMHGLRDERTYAHHLTAQEAGEIAAIAGVFELVITHMRANWDVQRSLDEASAAFAGPVGYAEPGSVWELQQSENA